MVLPFVFPPQLRDLEEDTDDVRLSVQNPVDIAACSPSHLEEFVKGVVFDLSDKELFCVEEQGVFDRVYSLIRDFSLLTPILKSNILESLRSNLSVLLPNVDSLSRASTSSPFRDGNAFTDHVGSYRNALKIYTFFLLNVALSEECNSNPSNNTGKATQSRKNQSTTSWNWEIQRCRTLKLIASSLEINLSLLFGSSNLDENYLSYVTKSAFSMFENASMLRDVETKESLCRIIGTCATKYHYTMQSCASILHILHKLDFVISHVADAVAEAVKKYGDGSLAISLIREIGRTNPRDYVRDTAGADNIGRFLVELADRLPKLVSTNIGILIPHFGGESYKIRNALVSVLGKLVAKAFNDVEGDVSSKSVLLRSKQAMLEILLERCKDVSAYTRSRVLQVWAELCERYSVPIGLWNELALVASGRLEDKTAIVRKSALNLLIMMLQHNPFGPQLRIASFGATLEKYKEKLQGMEPEGKSVDYVANGFPTDNETSEIESELDQVKSGAAEWQESVSDSCVPSVVTEEPIGSRLADFRNLEETRALVASLEAGLRFSKCMSSNMPVLVQLLASSCATDVESAINLLMRSRQFHIDGSEACLHKILSLVFSQDKSIYGAVEVAFITIYIKKSPLETAHSLLNLAIESNIGDLAALEHIVSSLASKGDISVTTISALWDFFSFNVNGVTAEQSRGALSVLCMVAKSSPGILSSHLQDIIDIGFGRWARKEPLLAETACLALERLSEADRNKLMSTNGSRVIGILQTLITGFGLPVSIWYAAADKALSVIYSLHPTPEIIAADMLKKSLHFVFDFGEEDGPPSDLEGRDISTVKVSKLSRFLFLTSQIALRQLLYIEFCVRKLQKQRMKSDRSISISHDIDSAEGAVKESGINAELGIAASEDAILDVLSERAEKEIVSYGSVEKNLIGYCAPFISKLCRSFTLMQKFPELQASGMLALCRLMIIDASFCEANLQLLFTVVENAPSEIVRSNCTIALGDLAVRFPNLLEPWTENVYARLQDPSANVRKNAVLVISHLILNDMMKVKGYINEMALRLEDEDERISNLAKLFFHELSKKGSNPIYNLLPDILGRFSNQNLKEEQFCNIMQFLIGSIKKDKQMESLVEKLCNRFCGVTDHKQWEYISYCLSQLTLTEKGTRKLMESFKSYEHVLAEDTVMDHFRNIINKGKKYAKPELKACMEEFEEKLYKVHIEKKEQEATARNAELHQQKLHSLMDHKIVKDTDGAQTGEDDTEDGAGVVINPTLDGKTPETQVESLRESTVVADTETGNVEVQSLNSWKGMSKSRAKKRTSK
ncbi:condensin-1 complex subunit CAP-D2 [Aristolochia californica]|uniref:condensin-1 complex subunit CAP-D2 n=1 Tax=Aristolochia californica TaxID=171875 RepID=UPI0035DE2DE5